MRVDTISVLLDRYGQCVTLYRGGVEPGREVRAFLQPLREAGREQARPSPLGQGGDMSGGLEQIREGLTAHLNGKGIRAVSAWSGTARTFPCGPVAAVSLRGGRWGPAGFQDYLGERYDPEAGRWEELYGRRVKLTFGLDLYGERAQGDQALQAAFDALAGALHREGPPGMRLLELSCGETEYDQGGQLLRRPVEAVYEACLYAAAEPGGLFQDFEIRGGLEP